MTQLNSVYISLGSNQGDRLKNLQAAVDAIFKHVGHIQLIAKVYNTPALGFEGDAFLNCVLWLQGSLSPSKVLSTILAIEKKFFCDKTTEKTVILTVTDYANDANVSRSFIILDYLRSSSIMLLDF